jgi:hypothetical protein
MPGMDRTKCAALLPAPENAAWLPLVRDHRPGLRAAPCICSPAQASEQVTTTLPRPPGENKP